MSCGVCRKSIRSEGLSIINCRKCKITFHAKCVNLKEEDIIKFSKETDKPWICNSCLKDSERSTSADSPTEKPVEISLASIMQRLNEMEERSNTSYKNLENELGKSIEFCHGDVASVLKKIEEQDKKLSVYLNKIDEQDKEISTLKNLNDKLQRQLCDLEQYSRSNCVEIHGIPAEKNEDVTSIVSSIGNALGHPINEQQIDNCHRLPAMRDSGRPPGIIVKFVRRFDKEALLKKRRIKRDFSTQHLGLQSVSPIYINESLCPERRRLLALARKAKGEKNYKFLWVRNGRILARRAEGLPVIVMETMQDLNKMTQESVAQDLKQN
jgi:hypothetical protein